MRALKIHLEAWWAGRAPAGHATRLRERARGEGWGGWPDWLRWWDGDRPEDSQGEGWGWGRDCRGGAGSWGNCGSWDAKIGGLGYAPSGFERILSGLGMERAAAKLLTGRIESLLKEGTREMWLRRVEVHREKEEERGITEAAKRDKQAAADHRREHG